jgi:hypothetical protein
MPNNVPTLDLSLISPALRAQAVKAFEAGDALGFLIKARAGNTDWLWIVEANVKPLKSRGIYEKALLDAFTGTRTNNAQFPLGRMRWLFELADPDQLRKVGDPLPGAGPFTLYRGVSGRGRARRVRGFSWTADLDMACWFACREWIGDDAIRPAPDPAVVRGVFAAQDVLFYVNERDEQEFVVDSRKARISKMLTGPMLERRAQVVQRRMAIQHRRKLLKMSRS